MSLYTFPGYALVKLTTSKYKHIAAQQKVYEAASSGMLLKANESPYREVIGSTVYWEEMNAKPPIEYRGEAYSYIKYEDLIGYEMGDDYVETD